MTTNAFREISKHIVSAVNATILNSVKHLNIVFNFVFILQKYRCALLIQLSCYLKTFVLLTLSWSLARLANLYVQAWKSNVSLRCSKWKVRPRHFRQIYSREYLEKCDVSPCFMPSFGWKTQSASHWDVSFECVILLLILTFSSSKQKQHLFLIKINQAPWFADE